jgi:putative addiction module component (TIGR02574 family)
MHIGGSDVRPPSQAVVLRELIMESRMNGMETSIFDLSPAEKLQLVEDLWDDLAGAPDQVPVHDWHKQELARRKANLLKNPTSGLSWEDVKQRARARYARLIWFLRQKPSSISPKLMSGMRVAGPGWVRSF